MTIKSIYPPAIGASFLILALTAWFRGRDCDGNRTNLKEDSNPRIASPVRTPQNAPQFQSNRHNKRGNIVNARKIEWNLHDFKPLDWSVDELDEFLDSKASDHSSRDMALLMTSIFPESKGAIETANVLKPGSIPLKDQMRLCVKYVKTEDRPLVLAGFWAKYRKSNALEEYRRDVLDQLPPGDTRTVAMTDYYGNQLKTYSDIVNFLTSNELLELKARESETRIGSTLSDYNGAVNAVSGTLRLILERGDTPAEEIIAMVKSSRLDEGSKTNIIRSIEKRSREVEVLRK